MTVDYPITGVAATPEYVLELLRDQFRGWGPPEKWLTFDTAVSDIRFEMDDLCWSPQEFATWMNDLTLLDLPSDKWEELLSPMRGRTIGELCRLIADRMRIRPAIRPWSHIAGDCLPAGAFLTARSLLAERGADADAITPSTPLCDYLNRYGPGWVFDLARMAPGRLPPIESPILLETFIKRCLIIACLLVPVVGLVAPVLAGALFVCVGFGTLVFAFTMLIVNQFVPLRYTLGNLTTFRDLAYCLAGQQPRRKM